MATRPARVAKPSVDEDAVGRDYRTGHFTDREIGKKYGRSHTWVQNLAKKNGWQSDLKRAVELATQANVVASEISNTKHAQVAEKIKRQIQSALPATVEVVAALAEVNSQVILRHRGELRVARNEVMELFQELRNAALTPEQAELLALVMSGNAAAGSADNNKAREAIQKAFALGGRIGAAAQLVTALAKLHEREASAYGLTDDDRNPRDERKSIPIEFVDAPVRSESARG